MADLIQKILANVDWNMIVNLLVAALAAWLGVPIVKKDPQKIPIIGRLWGRDESDSVTVDDLDQGFQALRLLDEIHARSGMPDDERRRLFVEGVNRIVTPPKTEAAK